MKRVFLVVLVAFLAGFALYLGAVVFAVVFRGWSIVSPPTERSYSPGERQVSTRSAPPSAPQSPAEAGSTPGMLDLVPGHVHPANESIWFAGEGGSPLQMVTILAPQQEGALSRIFTDYLVRIDVPSKRILEVSARRSFANLEHCEDAKSRATTEVVDAYDLDLSPDGKSASGTRDEGRPIIAEFTCAHHGASPYPQLTVRVADAELDEVVRARLEAAFPPSPPP